MKSGNKASPRRGARKARQRIFILDDYPMMRRATAAVINRQSDLEVCGEADTVKRALAALKAVKPDLVLTDLTMPGGSGWEFIKEMKTRHPAIPVLVLSMHDKTLYAERALRAGAKGYVMKSAGGAELIRAIRRILGD
jgi:DNA-binding NarL/FixJ family response regulator